MEPGDLVGPNGNSAGTPTASGATLKAQALRGARWTLYATLINLSLQVLLVALVARWVDRAEVGVVALAVTLTVFAQLMADAGVGQVIYRREVLGPGEPAAIGLFSTGLSLLLAAGVYAAASQLASLYERPDLTPLLHVTALAIALSGPGLTPRTLLQRALKFKTLAALDSAAAIAGTVLSLSLLVAGYGVISLAWGPVLRAAVATGGCLYFGQDLAPHARPEWTHLRTYLRIGSLQLLASLLAFAAGQADPFVTGALLGVSAIAALDMAKNLVLRPSLLTGPLLQRVMAPTLAQAGADLPRIRHLFLRFSSLAFGLNLPLFLGVALTAEPAVRILLGPKWLDVVPLVPFIAVFAVMWMQFSVAAQLLASRGLAERMLLWNAMRAALNLGGIWFASGWGIAGIAVAGAVYSTLIVIAIYATDVRRLAEVSAREVLTPFRPYLLAALIASPPAWALATYLSNPWLSLPLAALAFTGLYAGTLWRIHPEARELWGLIRGQGLFS